MPKLPSDRDLSEFKKNLEEISASCTTLGRLLSADCEGDSQEVPPIVRLQTRTLLENLSRLTRVTNDLTENAPDPPN